MLHHTKPLSGYSVAHLRQFLQLPGKQITTHHKLRLIKVLELGEGGLRGSSEARATLIW